MIFTQALSGWDKQNTHMWALALTRRKHVVIDNWVIILMHAFRQKLVLIGVLVEFRSSWLKPEKLLSVSPLYPEGMASPNGGVIVSA